MRILTHPVHTAWEYEFAKTGHEIWIVAEKFPSSADGWVNFRGTLVGGGGVWNQKSRPLPDNVSFISLTEALRGSFDVCVVHTVAWLEKLKDVACPIIFKVHVIPPPNFLPEWAEERLAALTFNGDLAMNRVVTRRNILKSVIHVPVDPSLFKGYIGDQESCLSVAHLAPLRPEKRLDRLNAIASRVKVDLVGGGNEGVPYAVGEAGSLEELISAYRHHAVFLEVADHVGMACIEAMTMGMPVVLFPPEHQRDLFRNGENCIIVENEEEAISAVRALFKDPARRRALGENARAAASARFNAEIFRKKWNELLLRVVRENPKI